ncbi:hypothetical protein V1522DRAFT_421423 [Lipomyces starkeyi]
MTLDSADGSFILECIKFLWSSIAVAAMAYLITSVGDMLYTDRVYAFTAFDAGVWRGLREYEPEAMGLAFEYVDHMYPASLYAANHYTSVSR